MPNTKMGDRRKRCDKSPKKIHISASKHRKPTSMNMLASMVLLSLAKGMKKMVTAINGTSGWKKRLQLSSLPSATMVIRMMTVAQPAASIRMGCAPTSDFVTRFCRELLRSMPSARPSTSTGTPKRTRNLPWLMGNGLKIGTSLRLKNASGVFFHRIASSSSGTTAVAMPEIGKGA